MLDMPRASFELVHHGALYQHFVESVPCSRLLLEYSSNNFHVAENADENLTGVCFEAS